ncbi:MAG: serine--tRNA ligase [Halobacteriovoraceae bacterium]|nr:serine--tRNA ligase [Halobacteriovoraceae bacterium]
MLDIKFIAANKDIVLKAITDKQIKLDVDEILNLNNQIIEKKQALQVLQEKRNSNSKAVPKANAEEKQKLIAETKEISSQIKTIEPELTQLKNSFDTLMLQVPQIPSKKAPFGKSDADNVVVAEIGNRPEFSFSPKSHIEILEKNNWAEFKNIGNVCGSRSYTLLNKMVIYEQAVLRLAMDMLIEKGFNLMSMPSLARGEALMGTGHFPAGEDQVYLMEKDNMYLSGTAEVQMNYLNANKILSENDLPILYAGVSPCFRREAGSYGKDVKGLIRVHQFLKVEQYILCKADIAETEKWHEILLNNSKEMVEKLELPYRVIECCTGDMGAGKYRMFDIECWVPSEQTYRETHSCSALLDWQARRTNTRYRVGEKEVEYCHTLNNTMVASPRILVPLIECHQDENGRIRIPKALRSYMRNEEYLN